MRGRSVPKRRQGDCNPQDIDILEDRRRNRRFRGLIVAGLPKTRDRDSGQVSVGRFPFADN